MKLHEKFEALNSNITDPRTRRYLTPKRVVYTEGEVVTPEGILMEKSNQITQTWGVKTQLINKPGQPHAKIVLDFGTEIAGSVRLMTWGAYGDKDGKHYAGLTVNVRLGESVMEALTPITVKNTTNDHAMRDYQMQIPALSAGETPESGFRFVCIELLDEDATLTFKAVQAVFHYRDIDYIGSFDCSDPQLTRIWDTAAYTVHLNMQEYLWDGIKRDRLVWMGDTHTEVQSIISVFGYNDVVPKSLDLIRNETPPDKWMNTIGSYSIWWLLNHIDWYRAFGDIDYLREQADYTEKMLTHLATTMDENGCEIMDGRRFMDWDNDADPIAVHAGLQALYKLAFDGGAYVFHELGDHELAKQCEEWAKKAAQHVPDCNGSKQAGALMAIAGMMDKNEVNDKIITPGGAHGYSTFYGYYILMAKYLAGDHVGALKDIKEFWGGMLDMGATTFWESFNVDWLENAAPIDEIVPEGKTDIHGDFGAYCYKNFRHSLCHGWASGPCPYLTNYVLGIRYIRPGVYEIKPDLAYLDWAKGTFPTPKGTISVSVEKNADGTYNTTIDAPKGIEIIK